MKLTTALLLFLFAAFGLQAEIGVAFPPQLKAGSMETCVVWGSPEPLTVELRNKTGTLVYTTQTWKWSHLVKDREIWIAMIAVEVDKKPGPGTLRVCDAKGTAIKEFPIVFVERSFRVEEIPLSKELTQLRASPDVQKETEAKEIYRIYSTFDPRHVWAAGAFSKPLEEDVRRSAFFGDSRKYLYSDGTTASDYHYGTDFACPVGTKVFSTAAGLVVLAKKRLVTGNTVVIEHWPGVYSVYFHLDSIQVQAGEIVDAKALVGRSGMTGLATGPHLHWEIRCGAIAVDALEVQASSLLDTSRLETLISSPAIEQKRG